LINVSLALKSTFVAQNWEFCFSFRNTNYTK